MARAAGRTSGVACCAEPELLGLGRSLGVPWRLDSQLPSPVPRQAWTHVVIRGIARRMRRRMRPVPAEDCGHRPCLACYCAVDRIASRTTTCSGVKFSRR